MEQKPNRVIIHHSGNASSRPQFLEIDALHKSKNFTQGSLGYFGGYHYLIEKTGHVFHYRLESETGQHDNGENINTLGICLAGNFSQELPTKAQESALASLLEEIMGRWKIPLERIDPHRWGDQTECPGLRLADTWARAIYLQYKINWLKRLILWMQKNLQ